ncbi:MAG: porin family protein [Bradyrhizobium sp.]|nr:porin family protein [Bradyrhizobium sp.]
MRRLVLVAAMWGAVSAAHAADLPDLPILRGAFTEGLTTSRVNWQGFYIGGQASYGTTTPRIPSTINDDLSGTFVSPPGTPYLFRGLPEPHSESSGYGAFAGYNWQWDDVILGVEGNYLHGGFRSTAFASAYWAFDANGVPHSWTNSMAIVSLSDFGSLRLRAGYAMGCFLPYVFGGAGFGSQTIERLVWVSPDPIRTPTDHALNTKLVYGYSAGVGLDIMLIGGLFARAEYEYQRVTSDVETNINTVRAGLGYKF